MESSINVAKFLSRITSEIKNIAVEYFIIKGFKNKKIRFRNSCSYERSHIRKTFSHSYSSIDAIHLFIKYFETTDVIVSKLEIITTKDILKVVTNNRKIECFTLFNIPFTLKYDPKSKIQHVTISDAGIERKDDENTNTFGINLRKVKPKRDSKKDSITNAWSDISADGFPMPLSFIY